MKWTDLSKIAIALEDKYPDADNLNLRFSDLRSWVMGLGGFEGEPQFCNERVLEGIQDAWIKEREDRK